LIAGYCPGSSIARQAGRSPRVHSPTSPRGRDVASPRRLGTGRAAIRGVAQELARPPLAALAAGLGVGGGLGEQRHRAGRLDPGGGGQGEAGPGAGEAIAGRVVAALGPVQRALVGRLIGVGAIDLEQPAVAAQIAEQHAGQGIEAGRRIVVLDPAGLGQELVRARSIRLDLAAGQERVGEQRARGGVAVAVVARGLTGGGGRALGAGAAGCGQDQEGEGDRDRPAPAQARSFHGGDGGTAGRRAPPAAGLGRTAPGAVHVGDGRTVSARTDRARHRRRVAASAWRSPPAWPSSARGWWSPGAASTR
jgi:hypothetical protein